MRYKWNLASKSCWQVFIEGHFFGTWNPFIFTLKMKLMLNIFGEKNKSTQHT